MSSNPATQLKQPQAILFTFETAELNICRQVARHWMKMYTCHEIDRGMHPGMDFVCIWSPMTTLDKIDQKRSFRTDRIQKGGYPFDIGAQAKIELCVYELNMLSDMVSAAVDVRLNQFLLIDKGTMADVIGPYLTQSWASSVAAKRLKEKLDVLKNLAGLFAGHSAYQSTCLQIAQLGGVEYAA
ncbi:hypothetical protein [Marinomonas atlantica]|uniref:hypothetical protein n=1 Tax=Marinomonas atlantica TaxID=1806668 RepID=UPI0008339DE6|nr:hypothetical protein [Marinomonas atlantica]